MAAKGEDAANGAPADEARSFRKVVWPLAVAETVVWAAMYYSFPALLPSWEADLGWSKTELSIAFTIALIVSAVLAPVAGRLIDHGFGKQCFAGGALLGAAMLILLSQVTALWQFYLVWTGLGIAMSSTLYEACFAILTRTMGPRAKRAITLVTLVAGFAGTVSFPSAHALAGSLGWRGAVLVFASAVVLVAVPLIWTGSRHAERHGRAHVAPSSRRASEAMKVASKAAFWLLSLSFAMIALDHGIVISHLLPMLDDRGLPESAAVLAASMIGPMQVAGRLAMMAGERYLSTLTISIGCYVTLAIAAGALFGARFQPELVVLFVICQGAGNGVVSIMRPVVTAELMGRPNFGIISGLLAIPYMGGYALGPTVAALTWQVGGYDLVLLIAIAMALVGLFSLVAAWRSAGPH